jgi:cytochrome c
MKRTVAARWLCLCILLLPAGCEEPGDVPTHRRVVDGNAERGRELIAGFGCGACHTIPGIRGARGMVGPPLVALGRRTHIAGRLPNHPDLLVEWLRDPPALNPWTLMPNVGADEVQARHMAAYLYTLR